MDLISELLKNEFRRTVLQGIGSIKMYVRVSWNFCLLHGQEMASK